MSAQGLVGRWRPEGAQAGAGLPFTEVELREDGTLLFSVRQPSGDELTELRYRIEDGFIITRDAAASTETRTRFDLRPDGSLLLEYGGHAGRYLRG